MKRYTRAVLLLSICSLPACSREKGDHPQPVADEKQLGIISVSLSDMNLDPGVFGPAASADEPVKASAAAPAAGEPLDTSTPEAAANAYVMIMKTARIQDLPQLLIPEQQDTAKQVIEAMGPAIAAVTHLRKALHDKLPDQQMPGDVASMMGGSEITVEKVEVNASDANSATASFTDAKKGDSETRTLKNIDGKWHIEETKLPSAEQIEQMKAMMEKITPAVEDVATRVENGEIADAAALEGELKKAVAAAMGAAPSAETPPASADKSAEKGAKKAPSADQKKPAAQGERPKGELEQQMDGATQRSVLGGGI